MGFFETLTTIQQAPRRTRKAIVAILAAIFVVLIGGIWWLEWQNFEGSPRQTIAEIAGPLEMLWQSLSSLK